MNKQLRSLIVILYLILLGVTGCSLPRNLVPIDRMSEAQVVGMSGIRSLEIDYAPSFDQSSFDSSDCSFLVVSGKCWRKTLLVEDNDYLVNKYLMFN